MAKKKKTESLDTEMQKDLNRSENEGYAIMYDSEKKEQVDIAKHAEETEKKERAPMMQIKDIMTFDPVCCMPDANLKDVAKMMLDNDCGEIPVIDGEERPIGVVTDRDIVCRAVAAARNPLEMKAFECMTQPCITISEEASIEEACELLEEHQIRRVPVVDDEGRICGIVAQADLATHDLRDQIVEVVEEVSQPRKRF